MTSVPHLPRAEQYPSRTATSWSAASNLISGITKPKKTPRSPKTQRGQARRLVRRRENGSCDALLNALGMKRKKCIATRPFRLADLAAAKLGQTSNRNANLISDLRLGESGFLDFGNDLVPVHINSFSNSRNTTLRQVEKQACDYSEKGVIDMTLASRLKEARDDKGWKKYVTYTDMLIGEF